MGICLISNENPNVLEAGPWPASHLRRQHVWVGRHNDVIDVERLRSSAAGCPAVERQLHRIESQSRAASETQCRPCATRDVVEPETLCGVLMSRRVELHPELYVVPDAPTQREWFDVALAPVAVAAPARHAVRFPCHRRIVGIETQR